MKFPKSLLLIAVITATLAGCESRIEERAKASMDVKTNEWITSRNIGGFSLSMSKEEAMAHARSISGTQHSETHRALSISISPVKSASTENEICRNVNSEARIIIFFEDEFISRINCLAYEEMSFVSPSFVFFEKSEADQIKKVEVYSSGKEFNSIDDLIKSHICFAATVGHFGAMPDCSRTQNPNGSFAFLIKEKDPVSGVNSTSVDIVK